MSSGPLKAWIFLIILSAIFIVSGYTLGDRQGLLVGVGLALGINCLIFFYGDLRTLSLFGCRQIEGQDPWGLLPLTAQLAAELRIPKPQLFLIDCEAPQAFSVGRSYGNAKICLTRGLLELLNPEELKAVLAVELVRIQRLDIFSFQVACALGDSLLIVAGFLDRFFGVILGTGPQPHKKRFFTKAFSPLAALTVRATVGPQNYLIADRRAADWIHNANGLAHVLWKLQSYAVTHPLQIPASMAHLFIVNPLTAQGDPQYFHVQPSIKRRIEHLLGYYPL